jgi:hypothetical protein
VGTERRSHDEQNFGKSRHFGWEVQMGVEVVQQRALYCRNVWLRRQTPRIQGNWA